LVISCFFFEVCLAQKYQEKVFYLDEALNPTNSETKAKYLLAISQKENKLFRFSYYHKSSLRLFKVETYQDDTGDVPLGYWGYYNENGQLDSCGYVKDGKRDDKWLFYNATSSKPDSAIRIITYKNGIKIVSEEPSTSIDSSKYISPTFSGNFRKFLESELKFPEQGVRMGESGAVKVIFQVDEKGIVEEIELQKSLNYFLDKEALRVIKKSSGKWAPGKFNGVPYKTYHLQAILFKLD
jgi:TonB family protein